MEMIAHSFYGGHDITVIPVFDVHLGSPNCMEQAFIDFIKKVSETPNVYLVLGGDLIDNGTRSSVTNIFRGTMTPSQQKKEMAAILEPVRDRILCMVSGNHERRSRDVDDDAVYDIAAKLDCEDLYRENIAFVKIQMGVPEHESGAKTNGAYRPVYVLTVAHGSGGGVLTGGSVNRYERFGYTLTGCDCLILGHVHKPFVTQPGQLVIDARNNKVSVRPFKVVSATSWTEWGDYAAQKMLLPSTHAVQQLTLKGSKKEIVITM